MHHLEHVLEGQRLEVKAVAQMIVGAYRLGVVVYYYSLDAGLFKCFYSMYRRIIELYSLPDANRTAPQDDHLGTVHSFCLVFILVS